MMRSFLFRYHQSELLSSCASPLLIFLKLLRFLALSYFQAKISLTQNTCEDSSYRSEVSIRVIAYLDINCLNIDSKNLSFMPSVNNIQFTTPLCAKIMYCILRTYRENFNQDINRNRSRFYILGPML